MKIITVYLPESYVQYLEEISLGTGASRSELLREAIKTYLIKEKKYEEQKIIRFFDYCINCERRIHHGIKESHHFHKNIEIFELKFCCACYEKFKGKSFEEFPQYLIDNIQKKIKRYKKYIESDMI
ncbi:MAG: ribbon-helix-helix domain-containing protein [Candidatus Hodarchaeota archaeon]